MNHLVIVEDLKKDNKMKKTIITLIFLLIPVLAQAQYEKTFSLINMAFIDYGQSVELIVKGNSNELNFFLGKKPKRRDLFAFGAASVSAFWLVEKYFGETKLGTILLDSILASEKYNIEENKQVKETGKRTFNTILIVLSFKI